MTDSIPTPIRPVSIPMFPHSPKTVETGPFHDTPIKLRLRDSNVPLVEHRRGLEFQCPGVNCTFTCLEGMSLAKIYAESELQIGNWLLSHEVLPEKKG